MPPKCILCYCDISPCSDNDEVKYEVEIQKSLLSQHLYVTFLLRDVLQVPRNQLGDYMGKCPEIEKWIVTCKKCQAIVEDCMSIYGDLLNVNRKLRKCKHEIVEIVKNSYDFAEKKSKTCNIKDDDNDDFDITDSCRNFVREYEYPNPNIFNPFTEGDLEALNREMSGIGTHSPHNSFFSNYDDNIEDSEQDHKVKVVVNIKNEEPNHQLKLTADQEPTNCQRQQLPKFKRRIHPSKRKFPPEQYDEFGKRVKVKIKSTCTKCGLVFASKQNLKAHMNRIHELKFTYHCKTCGLGKRYKKDMGKHEETCSKDDIPEETEICPEDGCKVVVSRRTGLETHFRDQHPTRPFFDVCTKCQQGCYTESGLKRHVTKNHKKRISGDGPIECEHCGSSFKNKFILETHQKSTLRCKLRYMSEIEATVVCEICAGRFSSEYNLQNHIKMRHEKQYKHNCEHCNMGFIEKESLKVHLYKKHDIKDLTLKFVCKVEGCGRVFCKGKVLEFHMAQHEGKPQFTCEECGKQFYDKHGINQHRDKVHESARRKKVKCDICGAEFGCRDYLTRHKKTVHKIIPERRGRHL